MDTCMKDFGPVYAFWLFSFERLNGVLGSFYTNCHLQLMRHFLHIHEFGIKTICNEYRQDFLTLIEKCIYNKGSLKQPCLDVTVQDFKNVEPLPPECESALTPDDRRSLVLPMK